MTDNIPARRARLGFTRTRLATLAIVVLGSAGGAAAYVDETPPAPQAAAESRPAASAVPAPPSAIPQPVDSASPRPSTSRPSTLTGSTKAPAQTSPMPPTRRWIRIRCSSTPPPRWRRQRSGTPVARQPADDGETAVRGAADVVCDRAAADGVAERRILRKPAQQPPSARTARRSPLPASERGRRTTSCPTSHASFTRPTLASGCRRSRRGPFRSAAAGLVAVAILLGCSGPAPTPVNGRATSPAAPGPLDAVRVLGNRFVDGENRPLRLLGFNHSGGEYSCVEDDGFFDTPDGAPPAEPVVQAMRAWRGVNAVRVPLNEQCWLGLPAVPARYAGAAYRSAVLTFVRRLNAAGIVAVLDLHRSAPADAPSRHQEPMPDRDHSPDFWRSVAATFAGRPAVVFDLFNEPFPYAETDTDTRLVVLARRRLHADVRELRAALRGGGHERAHRRRAIRRRPQRRACRGHSLGRGHDALAGVPADRSVGPAGRVLPRVLVQHLLRRRRLLRP